MSSQERDSTMHTAHNVTERDMNKVEICYTEMYDLLGQLLSFNDATSENEVKRKANKQFIKRICYDWMSSQYALQGHDTPTGFSNTPYNPNEEMGAEKG